MDKKIIYAVVIVAVLVVAAGAVYVLSSDNEEQLDDPSALADAELKVFGNINGDRYLDIEDKKLIEKLISDGKNAGEYPLADANQDKVLDQKDVDLVQKVIDRQPTTIWHINLYDKNKDGEMEELIESTKFPVDSCIFHGSGNQLIFMFCLGIIDEVKGLSYSSSADPYLYASTYLNPEKCVKLEGSSSSIKFEDGNSGASDLIKKEKVTALIAGWNRSQIQNWEDFENAGVDVVRVAGADPTPENLAHSAMLLGLLFDKVDRAEAYVDKCMEIYDYVNKMTAPVKGTVRAVASSSTGNISGPNSDYTGYITAAGAEYALKDFDFGSSSSIKVAEHPDVLTYPTDKIVHVRTNLNYAQTPDSNAKNWADYTSKFSDYKDSEKIQCMISGVIPPVLRVAYAAAAMFPGQVSLDAVNQFHQDFIDEFYNGVPVDLSKMNFLLTSSNMA